MGADTDRAVLVMGLLLLFGAIAGSIKQFIFNKNAVKSFGNIINIGHGSLSSSSSDGVSTIITVEFTSDSGKLVEFSTQKTDLKKFFVGQRVPIIYDKKDVNIAYINRTLQLFFPEIVMGIIGISIIALFFNELKSILGI